MYLGFSVLSQGCNCNVMSMLSPLQLQQLLYNLWFLVLTEARRPKERCFPFRGSSFSCPSVFFSFVLLCSITSTWKVLFSNIFIPTSFYPVIHFVLFASSYPILYYPSFHFSISQFLFLHHLSSLCALSTPQWQLIITMLFVAKDSLLLPFLSAFS